MIAAPNIWGEYVTDPFRWGLGRHEAQCMVWEEKYPVPSSPKKEWPSSNVIGARALPR
jgi:hypothetical protein